MPADNYSIGATFISEYYHTFCTKPTDLAHLYTSGAELRHAEGRDGVVKGSAAAQALARLYPGENRGKIVVKEMEILPVNAGSILIPIRVRGHFTNAATQQTQQFTQMFEIFEHNESSVFGITSDIISWSNAAETSPVVAPVGGKKLPPPPTLAAGDWAMETPPLFARPDPAAPVSPMEKPLAPVAAAPVAALDAKKDVAPVKEAPKAEAPKKHVDAAAGVKKEEPVAEEPARKRTAAEIVADKTRKDEKLNEEKKAAPAKAAEAEPKKEEKKEEAPKEVKAPDAPKKEEAAAPKEEEEVDLSKMTMMERIRYKQNLPQKPIEEKKEVEKPKKEEKGEERKRGDRDGEKRAGDRRREGGRDGDRKRDGEKRDGEKKEGDRRREGREGREGRDGERKKDGERKEGDRRGEKKAEGKSVGGDDKKLAGNVVYYDLILKGLPKGTTVEELYTLLDPFVSVLKPIKLEAKPDKADSSTIRTFAFVVLNNGKGKYKSADEALPAMKRAKLTLGGTNVIVDRVREKFDK